MVTRYEDKVIPELNYVIIDEADSVLIDEARTPLIISGQPKQDTSMFVEVDDFGNDNIEALICDEAFLQIYDNIFRFDEFYNARTMSWNEYLHAWGTYAICPFANAVVLATADSVPATALNINDGDSINVSLSTDSTGKVSELTLTPANSTSLVRYEISDPETVTIEQTENLKVKVTPLKQGSAILTAITDNGIKATATINVTE